MRAPSVSRGRDDGAHPARSPAESADQLAALSLRELCARLDREARAGTLESATCAVHAIAREVERVQASLAAELNKRGLP